MKTVDVLVKAKAIISNPTNWMQGWYCNQNKESPTCFCSLGAIAQATKCDNESGVDYFTADEHPAAKLLALVVGDKLMPGYNFASYNDSHTHAEVMDAFDKAIDLAKAEE